MDHTNYINNKNTKTRKAQCLLSYLKKYLIFIKGLKQQYPVLLF